MHWHSGGRAAMRFQHRLRQGAYSIALAGLAGVSTGTAQPARAPEFTRPTLTAVRLPVEPRFHRVVHEDDRYKVVSRSYGRGRATTTPGLFVFSKSRLSWIQILSLSTEHARLGHSRDIGPLPVNWDHGPLINEPYALMPLRTGGVISFPDRIVLDGSAESYRLDFHSGLDRESSLTSFWVSKADLEAAFEGKRAPAPATREPAAIEFDESTDGLIVPVRMNGGEWLRWRIDTKLPGILAERRNPRHLAVPDGVDRVVVRLAIGSAQVWETVASVGEASPWNNLGGLLGTGLFDRFRVSLDFDTGRARLIGHGERADGGTGERVPIRWREGPPVLDARFVASDGRSRAVHLCADLAESRPIVLRASIPSGRMTSVHLASFRFDDVPAYVGRVDAGCDAVLGTGFLRRFRATFDRPKQVLVLEPGRLFDVPYDYDLTGLELVANGRGIFVGAVTRGTIADAAGLSAGDRVMLVDGQVVMADDLADLRRSFRHDGRERLLTIERFGSRRDVRLRMLERK